MTMLARRLLLAAIACLAVTAAQTQERFPSRPIRIIPFLRESVPLSLGHRVARALRMDCEAFHSESAIFAAGVRPRVWTILRPWRSPPRSTGVP